MLGSGRWIIRTLMLGVCLAWIGALVWLMLDERYLYFLARGYRGLLVAGGLVLAAMAGAVALRGVPAGHGSPAGRPAWLPLAICLVPLVFLAVNPRPLPSAFTLAMRAKLDRLWKSQTALGAARLESRRPGPVAASGAAPATSPAGSSDGVRIVNLFIAYPENIGRQVEVVGMVSRPPDLPAGTFVVFRFIITCCAADARPAAVLVAPGPGTAGALPADTWVRLRGTIARTSLNGLDMPMLNATAITPIPAPANPYDD